MSSTTSSDPRLLLPDWLRDGDLPEAPQIPVEPSPEEQDPQVPKDVHVEQKPQPIEITAPFSERLSLDTRLDPDQLISATDLPPWLGGLERTTTGAQRGTYPANTAKVVVASPEIADPEVYDGVDAPENEVIDVAISGWILIAGAIGLIVLLIAAMKLYLS